MTKSTLYMAIVTALVATGAGALDSELPNRRPDQSSRMSAGQQRQTDKLSSEFGVTRDEVSNLRQKGLGWGEVRQALTLSRESGKSIEDIVKLHDDGKSWEEIAKQEGVKFDVSGKPIEKRGSRESDMNRGTRDSDMNRDSRGFDQNRGTDRGTRGTDRGTMDRGTMDRSNVPSR